MSELAIDQFSGTIQSIYESALEPERWSGTLSRLAALLDAERGVIGFTSPTRGKIALSILHEIDPSYLDLWQEEFASFDPWYKLVGALPRGTVVHGEQLIPWDDLRRIDVHRACFNKWGIDDLICAVVANHGTSHDFVTVHRRRSTGAFEAEQVSLLQRVTPHLVLAAEIHERLCLESRARAVEETLLDTLPYGVLLLDPKGKVLAANREAERIFAMRDGLGACEEGMQATKPEIRGALEAAVARACLTTLDAIRGGGALLAISRPSMSAPYSLLLCPVVEDTRERIFGSHPGRVAAIAVISDPDASPRPASEALARLFHLTPALSRLAAALAAGKTVSEYANEANVTQGTARQQLKELFARTGTSRQADLVRVILSSVAGLTRARVHRTRHPRRGAESED